MSQPDRTDIERIQRLLGNRYTLSWIIGRGGMSTVWLAWDEDNERDVAVKILKPEYTDNAEFRSRFRNEAEASESFHSDNVVATYDYGEARDPDTGATLCYIILEYVQGESLADVLSRERTLPESLAVDVLAQVALGLQTIHEAGMVHRDIKPGNLLITPQGVVKITDFGIAKAAAAVPLTQTGMVVGTAQYVSPEQAQGQAVGPASDVYSLGVVGYEMVAGRRPFSGDSTVSVAIKHISNVPPVLPETVSGPVRELIGICLRKDPRARYADGAELAAAISMVAQHQRPPQPHAVPPVDVDSQPFTEQIGNLATGPGTAVPPRQGPSPSPASGSLNAASAGGAAGIASAASRRHPAPHHQRADNRSGSGALIALGLVSLLAIGGLVYLLLSGDDSPAPNPATLTVTNEVTTGATSTPGESSPDGSSSSQLRPQSTEQMPTPTDTQGNSGDSRDNKPDKPENPSKPEKTPKSPKQTPPGVGGGGSDEGASDTPTGNSPTGGAVPGIPSELTDLITGASAAEATTQPSAASNSLATASGNEVPQV